ncbi:hypothetical protein [Nonomuraea basaltis]|uniref:hypothetical protein n=1 Tax=Nonomuraea basaltis TaxID=2495887 RepID=UPI00110C620D|nr:hypothetical protein [Nonomuraea basaltis]TMR99562.1 hypothetical protein EJK15_07045 [Nonomuraea basaltis]
MTITHTPALRVTGERIDSLVEAITSHRLSDVGVAARARLIRLLDEDSAAADRLINERTRAIENDPVYHIECECLPNAIELAAANANHLADRLAAYLGFYHDLPCEVSIDLVQGDGQVIPREGATRPLFVTEASPVYAVTWMSTDGAREMKRITADRFKGRLGKTLSRRAALPPGHASRVWDITVRAQDGTDVTSEFPMFTPRRDDCVPPFAEAFIPLDADPVRVVAHMEKLVQRYPDVWEGGITNGLGIFHWSRSGFLVEVQNVEDGQPAHIPLRVAIHRINCAALGLPMSAPEKAVERLIRIAEGSSHLDRATLYQLAIGERAESVA